MNYNPVSYRILIGFLSDFIGYSSDFSGLFVENGNRKLIIQNKILPQNLNFTIAFHGTRKKTNFYSHLSLFIISDIDRVQTTQTKLHPAEDIRSHV